MGIISIEQSGRLYWLGRYTERVFTTLKTYFQYFDEMLDRDPNVYEKFLEALTLPNVYQNADDFAVRYLFDKQNPDSVCANLNRAYDNAIVLREGLTSDMLCYIQLSLDRFKLSKTSQAPLMALQPAVDYLYAFWGCADDCLDDEPLELLQCGRYLERLDLYLRLGFPYRAVEHAYGRLLRYLERVHVPRSTEMLAQLTDLIDAGRVIELDRRAAINALESVLHVF